MPFNDIDSKFTLNAVGDITVVTGRDAINQSLRNLLLTPVGFRAGSVTDNQTYGLGMKDFLFDKVNNLDSETVRDFIGEKIARYEPRISVSNIVVTPIPDINTYEVNIFYILNSGTREIQEFKTILNTL